MAKTKKSEVLNAESSAVVDAVKAKVTEAAEVTKTKVSEAAVVTKSLVADAAEAVADAAEATKKNISKKKAAVKTEIAKIAAEAVADKAEEAVSYDSVVAKAGKKFKSGKAVKITDWISVQVTIYGEAEGVFYIEIKDGILNVMPYDYIGADVTVEADAAALSKILDGKLGVADAFAEKFISAFGNLGKALALKSFLK